MYTKEDRMNAADIALLVRFAELSCEGVLMRSDWGEMNPIPQGVSVFRKHDDGHLEYLFTKADKYPVEIDSMDDGINTVDDVIPFDEYGIVLYLNSCMEEVVSKRMKRDGEHHD